MNAYQLMMTRLIDMHCPMTKPLSGHFTLNQKQMILCSVGLFNLHLIMKTEELKRTLKMELLTIPIFKKNLMDSDKKDKTFRYPN